MSIPKDQDGFVPVATDSDKKEYAWCINFIKGNEEVYNIRKILGKFNEIAVNDIYYNPCDGIGERLIRKSSSSSSSRHGSYEKHSRERHEADGIDYEAYIVDENDYNGNNSYNNIISDLIRHDVPKKLIICSIPKADYSLSKDLEKCSNSRQHSCIYSLILMLVYGYNTSETKLPL